MTLINLFNLIFYSIKSRFDDKYGVTIHSEDPWIVTFDHFLTDKEVNALISTNENSWERYYILIYKHIYIHICMYMNEYMYLYSYLCSHLITFYIQLHM
jgi:hypothetical protein